MRLQVDLEFQKNNIKGLNKKYNVEMFSSKVRGGKAFAAEQKIRELKKRVSRLRLIKSKSENPHKLIKISVNNMTKTISAKYSISPDDVEKRSLSNENFQLGFNLIKQQRLKTRITLSISTTRKYICKNRKNLAERIKKNQHLEKFTKIQFKTFLFLTKKRSLLYLTKAQ